MSFDMQLENFFSQEQFSQWIDDAYPLNIVGQQAETLRRFLLQQKPSLRIRAIENKDIASQLLPRSRTLILDPTLAQWMMSDANIIKQLSLKTFEWVLMPFLIQPQPFYCLYSEEFSCQESSEHESWRWTIDSKPATVSIINFGCKKKYRLNFSLMSYNPGIFEMFLAKKTKRYTFKKSLFLKRFSLLNIFNTGINLFSLQFAGAPFVPTDPLEQRKALYFCLKNIELKPLWNFKKSKSNLLKDLSIRRFFHERGFFEIQTFDTNDKTLKAMQGLRSCFDYREGLTLRDYKPEQTSRIAPTATKKSNAVMWYCLRKTPTPYSEF